MTTLPKISIVTPSFNQGKFLEKTILSVLEQGYPNLEYIIIDGGSSDESVEVIRKYADRLTYWVSEPDRGQSHAINKGFERATGEVFGWLNSDDWYQPGALQAVAEAFAAHPEAGAVVGAGDMFSEEYNVSKVIEPFPVTLQSLYGAVDRFFMQPSCFFTQAAWKSSGPLDEELHLAMDLDLWLKIAKKHRYALVSDNLSVSLVHRAAKTAALAPQSLVDASLVIMRHGGEKEGRNRLVAFVQELHDTRNSLECLQTKKAHLEAENARLEAVKAQFIRAVHEFKREIHFRENSIYALKNSLSWRVTAPLRRLANVFSVASSLTDAPDADFDSYIDLDRMAALVTKQTKSKATVLVLDFNLGGGANLYSRNLIANLERIGHKVILLEYRYGLKDYHVEFNDGDGVTEFVFADSFEECFKNIVEKLAIESIAVSQLVSWPNTATVLATVMSAGIPFLVLIHDYFLACPNWTLFDYQEKYCGVPEDTEACATCLHNIRALDIPLEQHTDTKRIEPWRSSAGKFLAAADKVICFSGASLEVIKKAYPALDNIMVLEHSIPEQLLFAWRQREYRQNEMLTIAVIGGISIHKGSRIVGQLINDKRLHKVPVRVVIVGDILPLPSLRAAHNDRLVIHGSYSREDLAGLLEQYNVSAVLIPSLWPETFCYSASEALLLGYPVLCCDIGAQADRVRRYNAGWVVDMPYLDGLVSVIQQMIAMPRIVQEKSLNAKGYQPVSVDEHFSAVSDCLRRK